MKSIKIKDHSVLTEILQDHIEKYNYFVKETMRLEADLEKLRRESEYESEVAWHKIKKYLTEIKVDTEDQILSFSEDFDEVIIQDATAENFNNVMKAIYDEIENTKPMKDVH